MKIISKILRIIRSTLGLMSFFLLILFQVPTLLLIATFWPRFGIWQSHICMWLMAKIVGVRFKSHGDITKHRPLLLVSNHISVFELASFSSVFYCRFFAKAEVKKYPLVGWISTKFGNAYVSRNPAQAANAVKTIESAMMGSDVPFVIFPEGTTSNGSYVLPFKSSMFEFLKDIPSAQIQPVAIIYRDKHGNKIPPQVMADEYAFFANDKQLQPPYVKKEISAVGLVWKNLMRGGFLFESYVLPVFDTTGLDRKQIAAGLHKVISDKFEEVK